MNTTDRITSFIRLFDQALTKDWVHHSSASQKEWLLQNIARFYETVDALPEPVDPALEKLLKSGCRLAADLSDRIYSWSIDQVCESDQTLEKLYASVQSQLREKYQRQKLLMQSQKARQHTQSVSLSLGLGTILA